MIINLKKMLTLLSVITLVLSCGKSSSDDAEDAVTDYATDSNTASLALSEAFDGDVPDELSGDSSSLRLTATGSQEQCHFKAMTQHGLEEMHRIGNMMCHFEEDDRIAMPTEDGGSTKYVINFTRDPHDQQKGGKAVGEPRERKGLPEDAALVAAPARKVYVYMEKIKDGVFRIDMCDDHSQQKIELTTDEYKRTGSVYMHGKNRQGITQHRLLNFAVDLETDHLKLELFERLLSADDNKEYPSEENRRFLSLDLSQDEDNTTVPSMIAFSTKGTWRGVTEDRFGAVAVLGGFGEGVVGMTADDVTTFRRARFKTDGTSADEDDMPEKEKMAIESADIPTALDSDADTDKPENKACDLKVTNDATAIEVGDEQITANSSCDVEEFTRPDCTDTAKYAKGPADTDVVVGDRKSPQGQQPPSI